jgi:hypothetical protein
MHYTLNFLLAHSHVYTIPRKARRILFTVGIWKPNATTRSSINYPHMAVCEMVAHLSQTAHTTITAVRLCVSVLKLFFNAITMCVRAITICKFIISVISKAMVILHFSHAHSSMQINNSMMAHYTHYASQRTLVPASNLSNITSSIQCSLLNARSVCNKPSAVAEFIVTNQVLLLFLTESWLKNEEERDEAILHEASPSNFSYLNVPRKGNKKGGGLIIFYNKSLSIKPLPHNYNFTSFEAVISTLTTFNKTIVFVLIYRPPHSTLNAFIAEFDALCSDLSIYQDLILLGDFNIPSSSIYHTHFHQVLSCHSLLQLVTSPTHQSGNILDLVIVRDTSATISDLSVKDGLSDHDAVMFTLNCKSSHSTRKTITIRRLKTIDHDQFNIDLLSHVTYPFLTFLSSAQPLHTDITPLLVHNFDARLRHVLDLHAPLTTKRVTNRVSVPWWSPVITHNRRLLRIAEKRWRRSKLTVDRQIYLAQRKTHHLVISNTQQQYIRSKLDNSTFGCRLSWLQFHRMLGRHQPSPLPTSTSSLKLANDFNTFFLSKPNILRRTLCRSQSGGFLTPPMLPPISTSGFSLSTFRRVTQNEVANLILKSPGKTSPQDPLPASLLRKHVMVLLPSISALMNQLLTEGLPPCWKTSIISPLLKKKHLNNEDLSNYRPVAQLPFLSKICERLVYRRLSQFLESHNLLDPFQAAYRPHHSCEASLTYITDFAIHAMDSGRISLLVLLDLSSAFDCVDHHILLRILSTLGIQGDSLRWLHNYLTNRTQRTKVRDSISTPLPTKFGVPQGSVLGPLLFSIYMVGLRHIVAQHPTIRYIIYADDIQLITSCTLPDLPNAIIQLEACILDIKNWLATMKLMLNENKTELILLGHSRALNKCNHVSLHIGTSLIKPSTQVRSLGVSLDPTLSMSHQVMKIRTAAFSRLRLISRVKRNLRKHELTLLVKSLVESHLTYCMPLLAGLPSSSLKQLQCITNASIRLIHGRKKHQSIQDILSNDNCWLTVENRIKLRILLLLFAVLQHGRPTFLRDLLHHYQPSRHLRSTDQLLLVVPPSRLRNTDRAFRIRAPQLWNTLPLEMRQITDASEFRDRCISFLRS